MAGFMLKQCPFSCNVCDVKEHGNKYCADRDHEQVYQPCDARATAGASALLHTTAMAPLTPPPPHSINLTYIHLILFYQSS